MSVKFMKQRVPEIFGSEGPGSGGEGLMEDRLICDSLKCCTIAIMDQDSI